MRLRIQERRMSEWLPYEDAFAPGQEMVMNWQGQCTSFPLDRAWDWQIKGPRTSQRSALFTSRNEDEAYNETRKKKSTFCRWSSGKRFSFNRGALVNQWKGRSSLVQEFGFPSRMLVWSWPSSRSWTQLILIRCYIRWKICCQFWSMGIGMKANHSGYLSFPRQCRRCSQMLLDRGLRWHIIRSSQFRENRN